jgi:hypothetical protein
LAAQPRTLLTEEHGPTELQAHYESNDCHHRRKQDRQWDGQRQIEGPLAVAMIKMVGHFV